MTNSTTNKSFVYIVYLQNKPKGTWNYVEALYSIDEANEIAKGALTIAQNIGFNKAKTRIQIQKSTEEKLEFILGNNPEHAKLFSN